MNRRRAAVKIAALFAPLAALVLTLHAWGREWGDRYQYPVEDHGLYQISAPRGSRSHGPAARALDALLQHSVRQHGRELGLRVPARIRVHIVEAGEDVRLFGFRRGEESNGIGGEHDLSRGAIVARGEENMAALRHQLAHALIQGAGAAGWSPWLEEGLAGLLEERRGGELTGDLPSLAELLAARDPEFRGPQGRRFSRGACLLVAFLRERMTEGFLNYYRDEQTRGPLPVQAFAERIADPARVEALWKVWVREFK